MDEERETVPPSTSTSLRGRTIAGRYRLGSLLGGGGMGRVYAAEHVELGRTCAVKVLRDCLATHGEATVRFRIEARAAARLDHPNLVRVLDFGSDHGLLFLVTEHVEGEDLCDRLDGTPLSALCAAAIARGIALGLAHAHARGVVHRDVKAENVRITGPRSEEPTADRVRLFDFGTALILDDDPFVDVGLVSGTPAYMSPEQAAGERCGPASDLYSLGVLLFLMVTGQLPFAAATPEAVLAAHVGRRPPPPRALRPDLDPELETLILWCLRKRPEERPRSANELADALARIAVRSPPRRAVGTQGADPLGLPMARPDRTAVACAPRSRRRAASAGLALAGAALALGSTLTEVRRPAQGAALPDAPRPDERVAVPSSARRSEAASTANTGSATSATAAERSTGTRTGLATGPELASTVLPVPPAAPPPSVITPPPPRRERDPSIYDDADDDTYTADGAYPEADRNPAAIDRTGPAAPP